MSEDEKNILLLATERKQGVYSPVDMINGIALGKRNLVENLVVKGYLEEVPTEMPGGPNYSSRTIIFYRVTHKGLIQFGPFYKKIWFYFNGDIRNIIISIVTSIITITISILIKKY